jgi:hypothetical protein
MEDPAFCIAQAEACAKAAGETNLPRQREKLEQARDRWLSLATTSRVIAGRGQSADD